MNPAVIFDLDQTLINTSSLQHLRDAKNWQDVYRQISKLIVDESINQMMEYLNENNIKIIIITTSPAPYCSRIIKHCGWKVDGQICYHDVQRRKPDPESFIKAISDYDLDVNKTISAGDRDIDIRASNAVDLPSVACTWDSPDVQLLLSINSTYIANTPKELFEKIKAFFE